MNEEALVERRISDWKRLEQLCAQSDVKSSYLSNEEVLEFVKLYRRASGDLALIRTRSANEPLIQYLNNLVGRAHGNLYQAPRKGFFQALQAMAVDSAQTMRRNKWFVWTAFSIFFGAMIVAWFLVNSDRTLLSYFTGGMGDVFEGWKKGKFEQRSLGESIQMSGFYAGNNPFVSIITGAKGAGTMGIYSLYALFQNGAILGALASEMQSVGKVPFLFSSIMPHGVPELTGIIVAGAAGLRFGWAILNPGVLTRGQSLRASAKDGVTMIVMGVMLCFIAAPIEGFFSFNPNIPQWLKFLFGSVTLVAWLLFWTLFGKTEDGKSERQV